MRSSFAPPSSLPCDRARRSGALAGSAHAEAARAVAGTQRRPVEQTSCTDGRQSPAQRRSRATCSSPAVRAVRSCRHRHGPDAVLAPRRTRPFLPASVQKLYTTSTALMRVRAQRNAEHRGPRRRHALAGRHLDGTLYLRGGGDPTFGSGVRHAHVRRRRRARPSSNSRRDVQRAGIRSDPRRDRRRRVAFDSLRGTPATGYAANLEVEGELSGLAFDDGFHSPAESRCRAGPALFAAQQFAGALQRRRHSAVLRGRGQHRRAHLRRDALAQVASPPIATLIRLTNTPSDNFFAETLLKDLGARFGARRERPQRVSAVVGIGDRRTSSTCIRASTTALASPAKTERRRRGRVPAGADADEPGLRRARLRSRA